MTELANRESPGTWIPRDWDFNTPTVVKYSIIVNFEEENKDTSSKYKESANLTGYPCFGTIPNNRKREFGLSNLLFDPYTV